MLDRIETLEKIGTPPEIVAELRKFEAEEGRIRDQQFKPSKESAERRRLSEQTAQRFADQTERLIKQADTELEKELKAIDQERVQANALPVKGMVELDAEYNGKLLKRLISEQQQTRDDLAANCDLQAITTLSDPATIELVFQDSIANRSAAAFARIGAVAVDRLRQMATRESKHATGSPQDGPAHKAYFTVLARFQQWQKEIARQSPEARKEDARARHTLRVMNIRSNVDGAAKLFGIETIVTQAALRASLTTKTAQ